MKIIMSVTLVKKSACHMELCPLRGNMARRFPARNVVRISTIQLETVKVETRKDVAIVPNISMNDSEAHMCTEL